MKPFILIAAGLYSLMFASACNNSSTQSESKPTVAETENKKPTDEDKLSQFAVKYAQAWCSQKPDSVASYFAADGSLTVNNGTAAIGRPAIAKVAEGFMKAFPDMIVSMDSLTSTDKGLAFHWTLSGTNSGPKGTGKKVRISGVELWQMDMNGLIHESKGSYDADEYNRQLKDGVKN